MKAINIYFIALLAQAEISAKANLREQVKRSGRSQNAFLQKGLPA